MDYREIFHGYLLDSAHSHLHALSSAVNPAVVSARMELKRSGRFHKSSCSLRTVLVGWWRRHHESITKCKTLVLCDRFFVWFLCSVDFHRRSWNSMVNVCSTWERVEAEIYVFSRATLLWPPLRYCNGANTPVNCRFFRLFRGSRFGFMCHTAAQEPQKKTKWIV